MIQNVRLNNINVHPNFTKKKVVSNPVTTPSNKAVSPSLTAKQILSLKSVNTTLSPVDKEKYNYLLEFMKQVKPSSNSEGISPSKQMDILLKNGKLLQRSTNDNSTTLDNLYEIATTERACNLNPRNLVSNVLDILVNPRVITQKFGDIPNSVKSQILKVLKDDDPVKKDPSLMDVTASGTCAAASNEVNLADIYPAEYARWVSKLSSTDKSLELNIKLSSVNRNPLDAIMILDLLEAKRSSFNFDKVKIKVAPDANAYIRAQVQDHFFDDGERNVANVLVQSAIMQLGSQNTYNSLTDTRKGKFNPNSQGLIEIEKTFVESLTKDHEVSSLVYQKVDDNQNLIGYSCDFAKMEKHIKDTIDSGEDVIIGNVLTNETSGRTLSSYYNPTVEGQPNKIINGHEITIVDYRVDEQGNTIFICIDTDDDNKDFVEYSANYLLPKLNHAGYPSHIVEADEAEIMRNAYSY